MYPRYGGPSGASWNISQRARLFKDTSVEVRDAELQRGLGRLSMNMLDDDGVVVRARKRRLTV